MAVNYAQRTSTIQTLSPFPSPPSRPAEILERIAMVQKENLKRIEDDLDILKAYPPASMAFI